MSTKAELQKENNILRQRLAMLEAVEDRHRRIEEALRSKEAQNMLLFETMLQGVVYHGHDGTIINANAAAEKLLGLTRNQIMGRTSFDRRWRAIHEDGTDFPGETHPAMHALQTGESVKDVVMGVYHPLTDKMVWIKIDSIPLFQPGESEPYQVCSIFEDITQIKEAQNALRESIRKHEEVLESTHSAFWEYDLVQRVIRFNQRAFDLNGITDAPGYEMDPTVFLNKYVHPDFARTLLDAYQRVIAANESDGKTVVEIKMLRSDGAAFWVRTHLWSGKDTMGRVVKVHGVHQNISEQKNLEIALRTSEERYRSFLESQDSAVASFDAEGICHYANAAAAKSLRVDAANLIGRHMSELFPPEVTAWQLSSIRQTIASGEGRVSEARSAVAGHPRWYRTSIQPIRNAEGEVVQALINAVDITAQKEAELVLEERVAERTAEIEFVRQRLELATASAGIGIWELNVKTNKFFCDDQVLKLFGLTRDDFDGTLAALTRFVPIEDLPLERMPTDETRTSGIYDLVFRVNHLDGTLHYFKLNAVVLYNQHEKPRRIIGTVYDITSIKQAEETLQRANRELERAVRMKDEFLAGMSHELRTPLTGILGLAEALQFQTYGPLSEKQLRALATIEASGRHLLDLINDILDVSKIEAGQVQLIMESCPLSAICKASLEMIKGMAQQKGLSVSFSIDPSDMTLWIDTRRIKQVLVNLLSNAVKFTPDSGAIGLDVRGDAAERVVRLTVWDEGIGIRPEDQEKLFTPFTQLDSGLTRQQGGTGLGLVLVQRLTALHGGSIGLESTPGAGSRFTVTLPWAPEQSSHYGAD